MKLLYSSARENYSSTKADNKKCPFCGHFKESNDEQNLILKRFNHCAITLNLYPYNPGHILVIPYNHTGHLHNLTNEEQLELIQATSATMNILPEITSCTGINMGMNTGGASGGSIPDHLHIHIVPRFTGDTNFLSVTSDVKLITEKPHNTYKKFIQYFRNQTLK